MKLQIRWNIFLNVDSLAKCRKVLARVEKAIGSSLEDVQVARYPKDQIYFKVSATTEVDAPSIREGLFAIMTKAGRLSRSWTVSAPFDESAHEFGGASQSGSIAVVGVDSVSFNVIEPDAVHA